MSLNKFINDIHVVDSHAHPGMWDMERGHFLKHKDLVNLFPEAMLLSVLSSEQQNELISDSQKLMSEFSPLIEKWAKKRTCCHYEIIQEKAYEELYGGHEADLVDRVRTEHFTGVYENIVKNSKIEFVMANLPIFPDEYEKSKIFKWVPYLDQFIFAKSSKIEKMQDALHDGTIGMYERALSETLRKESADLADFSLKDFCDLIQKTIFDWKQAGVPACKINSAYVRSLNFEDVDKEIATRIWDSDFEKLDKGGLTAIQDYLACFAIRCCAKIGLPIQIHAAFGDAPGLLWKNAMPVNLEKIFADPSFFRPIIILLHGGMPDYFLAGWYASTYANVYLDFSWLSMYSDNVLIRCLNEWLDYVPINKLLFGTDAWSPELFWAATNEGRKILSKVLSVKMKEKRYSAMQCEEIAIALLRENSLSVYNLGSGQSEKFGRNSLEF